MSRICSVSNMEHIRIEENQVTKTVCLAVNNTQGDLIPINILRN